MAWHTSDIPDQHGRTFVVTGANGGLGEVATRVLAGKGATVVMACRNVAKAQQIAAGIDGDVRVAALDLASLQSVRDFASQQTGFDVLVNNAGIMNIPMSRTVDGFETQFGVNHLGHFALTGLLFDKISDRVVTMASVAHRQTPKLWIDDLNYEHRFYQRNLAYAQSKLANLMFARELQRRLTAAGSPKRSYAA
ncbi:MAG TPA: SDR family NAD(P)-dependent oxidoreductase, partial [Mycobacterium sp.]|nr:SDR family NAD(P)-dependent oxidoreductase [Mycobacterium sp.]